MSFPAFGINMKIERPDPPVVGQVWVKRGSVPGFGTPAQRLAWAQAAEGEPLHCEVVDAGLEFVDVHWAHEEPTWIFGFETNATRLVRGIYRFPLAQFVEEWEPLCTTSAR